jgi:hypothetical protein
MRASCGPMFLMTTSRLPSTSSTCSARRSLPFLSTSTGDERCGAGAARRRPAASAGSAGPRPRPAPRIAPARARRQFGLAHLQHLLDQDRRQRIGLAAAGHQHHLRDGQRQRQVDGEARALAGLAVRSTRPPSARASDAPRPCRRRGRPVRSAHRRSRSPARKSVRRSRVADFLALGFQPPADRLGADAFQVEAGAVVAEADHHFVALLADLHQQLAGFGLPPRQRASRDSTPCTMALRSRCSNGAAMRSSTLRSISTRRRGCRG